MEKARQHEARLGGQALSDEDEGAQQSTEKERKKERKREREREAMSHWEKLKSAGREGG